MSSVLAIILNWRTAEMTLRSAEAARLAMTGLRGAITIVDNDSQDGSFEWLSRAVHQRGWDQAEVPVRVVQSGWNGGFGAGNNVGIRGGLPNGDRPDYLYILNSDAFPEPDAIRRLHDYLDTHPKVGFAGSAILGEKGDIHHTAFRFPSVAGELEQAARTGPITRILRRAVIAPPLPQHSGPVDWLAGASMMMRQSVLDQIGLFDETFFCISRKPISACGPRGPGGQPITWLTAGWFIWARFQPAWAGGRGFPGSGWIPGFIITPKIMVGSRRHWQLWRIWPGARSGVCAP